MSSSAKWWSESPTGHGPTSTERQRTGYGPALDEGCSIDRLGKSHNYQCNEGTRSEGKYIVPFAKS